MKIIIALLWLGSIALSSLAGYAYVHKGLQLYLLIFTVAACLIGTNMFSLLAMPVRYRIGERTFRHRPEITLLIAMLGIIVPFTLGLLALEVQWITAKVDVTLIKLWCTVGTLCNIYASLAATKAANAM